jgi:hypothetical protein
VPWGRVLGREGQWFHPPVIAKAAAAAPLRERLPAGVRLLVGAGALWAILALNIAFGSWLLAVRAGAAPCSGIVCTAATLGDHPGLALVLTGVCASALAAVAPITRGLSRANGPQLALIVVGALTGVLALAGLIAVLAVAALGLVVAFGVFVFVIDRL